MQVRSAGAADAGAWDDFVRKQPEASPYHRFHWPTAVERAYGHRRHCLVAERQDRIVGVLPLVLIRSPFGSAQLCSLPFCDVGGSLADEASVHEQLLQAAVERATQLGATLHVRRRAAAAMDGDAAFEGKVSMRLPLPTTAAILFGDLKTKVRSQVRKAGQNGLSFRSGRDAAALADFYTVFAANMRDLGSPVHSRRWFEAVIEAYGADATIGVVNFGELAIGAGLLLTNGQSAAIPWASTLASHNRLAPNMLLYWHLLEHAIDEKHCTVFDFGRSSFGEGTYRFKKQWGAVPVPLEWFDYSATGEASRIGDRTGGARSIAAAVWKRLPLPVANLIGPWLRRFVSL
jgi:FemAB-related protein (PEP-CTERM system-associated)